MSHTPSEFAHRPWVPFILLGAMWVLLALIVIPTWGWTYWDFGDGNYMYIARRVREGLVLYRDILAPQPPLHTFGGVAAQFVGHHVFGSPLIGVRLYCLVLRMAASLAIMLLAWRFWNCPFRGVVAAAIYLALPIGFWWSLGYQSENLEIVFLVLALWLLISWQPRQVAVAGGLGALAALCNMTAAPYFLVNAIFLAFRMPRLLPWYLVPFFVVYTLIALPVNIWSDGAFVSNVLLNQVGTFPRTDILQAMPGPPDTFLQYAFTKVYGEALKVVELEGTLILAALVSMTLAVSRAKPNAGDASDADRSQWLRTEFLVWSAIGMLLSICFTAKGGTVNYIFVLGEPAIALFAADAFVRLARASFPSAAEWRTLSLWNTGPFLRALIPIVVLAIAWLPAWKNIRATLWQVQAELPEAEVLEIRRMMQEHTRPGDMILAPPFYAFLTDTVVVGELAENYIWQIKYLNETFDAQQYGRETGEAVLKMDEIAMHLRRGDVSFVLLDMAQTGTVPAIQEALRTRYLPLREEPLRTRNTSLGVFVPR